MTDGFAFWKIKDYNLPKNKFFLKKHHLHLGENKWMLTFASPTNQVVG